MVAVATRQGRGAALRATPRLLGRLAACLAALLFLSAPVVMPSRLAAATKALHRDVVMRRVTRTHNVHTLTREKVSLFNFSETTHTKKREEGGW